MGSNSEHTYKGPVAIDLFCSLIFSLSVTDPYPECDWNQGYHLVSPHLDAGQGKVVRPG